ncbi:MAG: gamma-glutamylcyclotransferase [Polyangiaceae bacterium]
MNHLVFVYGSLMRGQGNHRLLERARFVRAAHTSAAFTLVDLGAYPGLLAGGTTAVRGEVYVADDETLAALDRLEGHPNFYRRQGIALKSARERVEAYLLPAERYASYPMVVGGDWQAHLAKELASSAQPDRRSR